MPTHFSVLLTLACLISLSTWADDTDTSFGQIKEIDLSEDRPAAPAKSSDHLVMMLNLNKVKAGKLAQVIIYQFSKRVRLQFEAEGLPKGEYVLAVGAKCSPGQLGKAWTELHRFKSTAGRVQTEKSLPKASLREGKPDHLLLTGKSLGLFRITPSQLIDCKTIGEN